MSKDAAGQQLSPSEAKGVFHILVLGPAPQLYTRQLLFFLVTGLTFIEFSHYALVTALMPTRMFLPDREYCTVFALLVIQRRNNSFLSVFCNQAVAAAWINLLPSLRTLALSFSISLE